MYKIVKPNPVIFRAYDVRGVSHVDLSEDVYYTLAKGYAAFLAKRRIFELAVGRDNRLTSEIYTKAFIKGLVDSGMKVYDLGLSQSQIVYFSSYYFRTKGGAMITASHNPKEFNGMKLSLGYSDTMVTSEMNELQKIVENGEFIDGVGSVSNFDIFPAYIEDISKHFKLKKKWKVVVDGCNSTSGKFYPELLRKMGLEVIEQNTNMDGNFPLGDPDPTEQEVLERLGKGVREHKAELGFAYDTDGDRMAVVDEKGRVLWMDSIVALFAKDILDFLPGSKIVFNVLCSKQVKESIDEVGGESVMWKTGHSFIKAKVKEERAPFGGELSGHIFFMDNFYGHDDGAFATLRLISYLERTNQTLGDAFDKLPHYVSSPEIKIGVSDEIKFNFIDTKVKDYLLKTYPNSEKVFIDGVRIDTDTAMVVIRASQNGPYFTIKFEAKTTDEYEKIKIDLKKFLLTCKEVNWNMGTNVKALD